MTTPEVTHCFLKETFPFLLEAFKKGHIALSPFLNLQRLESIIRNILQYLLQSHSCLIFQPSTIWCFIAS